MRQLKISIRVQLVILVSFVMVLSLMILTVATTVNNARSILNLRGEQLQTIAMLKSAQVSQAFSVLYYIVFWYTLDSETKMALVRYKAGNNTAANWGLARQSLQATLDSNEVLLMGAVYDSDFNLVLNVTTNVTNISATTIDPIGPLFPFDARKQNYSGQAYITNLLIEKGGYISNMVENGTYFAKTNGAESTESSSLLSLPSPSSSSSSSSSSASSMSSPELKILTSNDDPSYFLSITLPIYGNASVLLATPVLVGYVTLAMRAVSLYNIVNDQAGIQGAGQMVLLSSINNFNPFSPDLIYFKPEELKDYSKTKSGSNTDASDDDDVDDYIPTSSSSPSSNNLSGIVLPTTTASASTLTHSTKMPGFIYLFPVSDNPDDTTNSSLVFPASSYYAYMMASVSGGNSGWIVNSQSPFDNSVSVGYAPVGVQFCDWIVIIEEPHSETFSSIKNLINVSVSTAVALGVGITLAIFPIAHFAVAPVRRLMAATEQTTLYNNNENDNNYNSNLNNDINNDRRLGDSEDNTKYFRIPGHIDQGKILVSNELTKLTDTFNHMTDELHKQYNYLEDRVQERTQELSLAKTAAENANEAKTIFIANITHELRTPLNGILGMTAISLTETDLGQIRRSLRVIFKSGELLLHLLTDLLTFSKNHKSQKDTPHRMTLDEREFYITEISSQVRAIFSKQARDKAVDLTLRVRPAKQVMQMGLYADSNRILQIVINMTSNALKFTPRGGKVDIAIVLLGEFDPVATADNGYDRLCVKSSRTSAISNSTKDAEMRETPADSPGSSSNTIGISIDNNNNNSDHNNNIVDKDNDIGSDSYDSDSDFESEELRRLVDHDDDLDTEVVMHIGTDPRRTGPPTPKDYFGPLPGPDLNPKKSSSNDNNNNSHNNYNSIHLLKTPVPDEITSITRESQPPRFKRTGSAQTTHTIASTPFHGDILRDGKPLETTPLTLIFEITVSDNGPGIAPALQKRVFEPFVQGEQNLSRQHGGTGLGLSICRQLATMMGGFMLLKSEQGVGSSFTLQVPIKWTKRLDFTGGDLEGTPTTLQSLSNAIISATTPHDPLDCVNNSRSDKGFVFQVTPPDFSDYENDNDTGSEHSDEYLFDGTDGTYFPSESYMTAAAAASSSSFSLAHPLMPKLSSRSNLASSHNISSDTLTPLTNDIKNTKTITDVSNCDAVLDLSTTPSLRPQEGETSASSGSASVVHILIAEDNKVNQMVITRMLALEGLTSITVANDGLEAVDLIEKSSSSSSSTKPFDLIFMDVQMPRMDGLMATKAIRNEHDYRGPIIGLSALASADDVVDKCMQAGMDGYLSKPIKREILHDILKKWLPADVNNEL